MNFDCLSEYEVRRKYQEAEDKGAALEIIADLTSATKREVKKFLGIIVEPQSAETRKAYTKLNAAEAMRLYGEGLNDADIAAALGVTKACVGTWRRNEGLTAHITYKPRLVNDDERMRLYHMGLSDAKIGRAIGIEKKSVWAWRKRRGLPANLPQGGDHRKKEREL